MKSVVKFGICLLLLLFYADLQAQNNNTENVKKEGIAASLESTSQFTVNRDTSVKANSRPSIQIKKQNQDKKNVIVASGRSNPRINGLDVEINRMVAKYKSYTVKAGAKTVKEKFSGLSESQKERVRREADAYYLKTKNRVFIHGDHDTKWKLIERYYNENYTEKTPRVKGRLDTKRELYQEIRKKLSMMFDLKEEGKREEIRKLEKQVNDLKMKLRERKSSKKEIVNNRLRELLGEPDNLKW
jgi:hypothetical protein